MKKILTITALLILILAGVVQAWTPISDIDMRDVFGMWNVTNITAQYYFGDGSELTGIGEASDTNCTAEGSCSLITYDSETSSWDKDTTNDVEWGDVPTCAGNDKLTSSDGLSLTCETDQTAAGGDPKDAGAPYLYNDSTTIYFNDTYGNSTYIPWDNESDLANGHTHAWDNLSDYPTACTGTNALTALNDSVTCSDFWWNQDADVSDDAIGEGKISFSTSCSAGYFYRHDGGNDLSCTAPELVYDTTPQLGGYLDANAQDVGSATDEIENVYIGTDNYIYLGDGQESSIHWDNAGSYLVIKVN